MIKSSLIKADAANGTAPWHYTFFSNNSCVTFSDVEGDIFVPNGSGQYVADTYVNYTNEACIETSSIYVKFTDSNGCTSTKKLTVPNPCTISQTITSNGDFVFVSTVSGGSGQYSYNWTYDSTLFELYNDTNTTDNYLSLKIKSGAIVPTSVVITCTATDLIHNCVEVNSITYPICKPSSKGPIRVTLNCDSTPLSGCSVLPLSQYRFLDISNNITPCAGQELDWSTLSFTALAATCVVHHGNGIISIATNSSTASTKDIPFTVKTTTGITSVTGTVSITIPSCANKTSFNATPTTIQLTANDSVSDVKVIPVEPRVSGTPNWSTFTITNTPSFGTVTFNANREIEYTITDITTTTSIPDIIKWTLNDTSGRQVNITDTVLRDVIAVPATVTDSVCATCGAVTPPFDVLANDTGDIDRSTLTIVLNDPDMNIVKDSDNNLIFTPYPGASFSNLNSYKVANTQGAFSANQNFFVRVACVGDVRNPTIDLTCLGSKIFDILGQFTNYNAFNVVYTETSTVSPDYTTQGGSIVGVNGTLDFTSINNGTYTFEFTAENVVACHPAYDDTGTLTVIHGATPNITITSATDNSDGTSTYNWTYSGTVGTYTVTLNASPATFLIPPTTGSGTGTLTLYNTAGVNTVVISATNVCGGTSTDSDNSITV